VVTGERGLDVLAGGLRARGALAEVAEVYRRVPMPYEESRVVAALRGTHAIIITSGEALDHLLRLTPAASQASLLRRLLIAPSERVVALARERGFVRAYAPPYMADAQLVQLLGELARAGRADERPES
jgi:uroporphyrinogen-III synthase